ncbi:hypothetical protein NDN08_005193 [Rhodosorus marinus]|uniref:Uncharacterized protein n=1 Tax=Rhodosorus marinus TaxID=101924 RepID=A0AAV8V2L2_9RHOD|nr:hypothetical protein NDN08_005193 [Rhodosorus marinus]
MELGKNFVRKILPELKRMNSVKKKEFLVIQETLFPGPFTAADCTPPPVRHVDEVTGNGPLTRGARRYYEED